MSLNEETAIAFRFKSKTRTSATLILSTALAALGVVLVGNITFIGLLAGHITRQLLGGDHRISLPSGLLHRNDYLFNRRYNWTCLLSLWEFQQDLSLPLSELLFSLSNDKQRELSNGLNSIFYFSGSLEKPVHWTGFLTFTGKKIKFSLSKSFNVQFVLPLVIFSDIIQFSNVSTKISQAFW